jgi:hypothetical protein
VKELTFRYGFICCLLSISLAQAQVPDKPMQPDTVKSHIVLSDSLLENQTGLDTLSQEEIRNYYQKHHGKKPTMQPGVQPENRDLTPPQQTLEQPKKKRWFERFKCRKKSSPNPN